MTSQGLSHPLAMAITAFWTIQDECRNPRPDPPDELCQPVLGRLASMANYFHLVFSADGRYLAAVLLGMPHDLLKNRTLSGLE
jgi:hypothetical protein